MGSRASSGVTDWPVILPLGSGQTGGRPSSLISLLSGAAAQAVGTPRTTGPRRTGSKYRRHPPCSRMIGKAESPLYSGSFASAPERTRTSTDY